MFDRQPAFTLIEVLVSVTILAILAAFSLSMFQNAYLRSQITQCHTDMVTIGNALEAYRIDHSVYPITDIPMQWGLYVEDIYPLTTPISYLTRVPFIPWYGQKKPVTLPMKTMKTNAEPVYKEQSNYFVVTSTPREMKSRSAQELFWTISGSGPMGIGTSSSSRYWYSPSNGLYSVGGFWLDSYGRSSFK